jgi:hypothetical protein
MKSVAPSVWVLAFAISCVCGDVNARARAPDNSARQVHAREQVTPDRDSAAARKNNSQVSAPDVKSDTRPPIIFAPGKPEPASSPNDNLRENRVSPQAPH